MTEKKNIFSFRRSAITLRDIAGNRYRGPPELIDKTKLL